MMRITDSLLSNLVLRGSQRNLGSMTRLQQIASSGSRINSYADDPSGVGAIQRYNALISQNEGYQRNIGRARLFNNETDMALQDLLMVIQDARELGVQASSAGTSDSTHHHIAGEFYSLITEAISIMNRSVEGSSLFAGFQTGSSPFVNSYGEVHYQGDLGQMMVQVGPNSEVAINIPGSEILGSDLSLLTGTLDMATDLTTDTNLSELSLGQGWSGGIITVTTARGEPFQIDLAGSDTIEDVIRILEEAGLQAEIRSDKTGLKITDPNGGPLVIAEYESGSTAASLGILGSSDDGIIAGSDIRVQPSWDTLLSDINTLDLDELSEMTVEIDNRSVTMDFSSASTLGDIKSIFDNALSDAGMPALEMFIDGDGISIRDEDGSTFRISNPAGFTTASALGLEGSGSPARLFDTLHEFIYACSAHDTDRMKVGLDELEAIEQHILNLVVSVGNRGSILDSMDSAALRRDFNLQSNLSIIADADMVAVATDLARAETAYQSSLQISSRLLQTRLFDYL
jgi:flagellin-like hook-associated protein FlgL